MAKISALAGALPTQNKETVWIALMNVGQPTEKSEFEQEHLLNDLSKDWLQIANFPPELALLMTRKIKTSRTEIIH
ncbi:hypothetical protein [Rippkaea orientalis]|uniref:hypothetical protein n=1 Tax=Rippkaea orientalis TaxID=2546366 RepID=UPI000172303E|nr:hypothetical protein [Rippkaea orientalis]